MSRDKTLFEKLQNSMGFFYSNTKTKTNETSAAAPQIPAKKSAQQQFVATLPKNIFLALVTVPFEGLALRRIFDILDNPQAKPVSYYDTIKKIGAKGLFAGPISRTNYCLVGNYATLWGVDNFGSDYLGLLKTTIIKNAVLPFFLVSNARQVNMNFTKTLSFVAKGVIDPVVHLSFFSRNLAANFCGVLPGFRVRDYSYQLLGESNTQIPTLLGFTTSVFASTLMNAFLKPFFTGTYPLPTRRAAATSFPAILPLIAREAASLGLIFGNTSPQKKLQEKAPEENQESTIRPK